MNDELKQKIAALPDCEIHIWHKMRPGFTDKPVCRSTDLKALIDRYERRIADLRQALGHYADEGHWDDDDDRYIRSRVYRSGDAGTSPDDLNGYEMAQAALKADEQA